jgi:hypothetical protein
MTDQEKQDFILEHLKLIYCTSHSEEPYTFIPYLKNLVNTLEEYQVKGHKVFDNGPIGKLKTEYGISYPEIVKLVREYIVFKEIVK